jgi:hypothetical protein
MIYIKLFLTFFCLMCGFSIQALASASVVTDVKLYGKIPRIPTFSPTGEFLSYCSGALIKSDLVATARHCLEGVKVPKVIFGRDKDVILVDVVEILVADPDREFNNFYIKDGNLAPDWMSGPKVLRDLVVLKLKHPVTLTSPFKLSSEISKNLVLEFSGYPHSSIILLNNLPEPIRSGSKCGLLEFFGKQNELFSHNCIGGPGLSGAPLYYVNAKGDFVLIGLASYGSPDPKAPYGVGLSFVNGSNKNWIRSILDK